MTVFVAHAPADREAAEALESAIERRGQFVELDDGQTALRPVGAADVVVLLFSANLLDAPTRLRLEQRALDAWSEGRLIAVKLDQASAPVGLRDLPAVDASAETERDTTWGQVADAVTGLLQATKPDHVEPETGAPVARRRAPLWRNVLLWLATLPGLLAIAASVSIWLVNRIGPTPGGWRELRAGIDAFGVRYGLAPGMTEWIFLIAIAATLSIIGRAIYLTFARRGGPTRSVTADATDAVFVSYAQDNAPLVLPVIESATNTGGRFSLDHNGAGPAEVSNGIRAASGVLVMCSKAAFDSDRVKREIYLADRFRKRLAPVFVEAAEPPEDFAYFFAGAAPLNLFETPEADRPQALMRALGPAT